MHTTSLPQLSILQRKIGVVILNGTKARGKCTRDQPQSVRYRMHAVCRMHVPPYGCTSPNGEQDTERCMQVGEVVCAYPVGSVEAW